MEKIQAIRGMHDIAGPHAALAACESVVRRVMANYGYEEIRLPLVEDRAVQASIGEVTDIVEKEMYTFEDRNGDSLTLRPGAPRAVCGRAWSGLLHNQINRLWYAGPMFATSVRRRAAIASFTRWRRGLRHCHPDIDVELILLSSRLWRELGIAHKLELQINTLGTAEERHAYRAKLVDFFRGHYGQLDEDSRRRLETNPLRILDSKNPDMRELIQAAPVLADDLGEESRNHFQRLKELLDEAGVSYVVNPTLVRGLDYYSRTVFEWVTHELGAQGTVCAGGRYDGLIEQAAKVPLRDRIRLGYGTPDRASESRS